MCSSLWSKKLIWTRSLLYMDIPICFPESWVLCRDMSHILVLIGLMITQTKLSWPNYLVYVNTLLFYCLGGGTPIVRFLLAAATTPLLLVGTGPIAYICKLSTLTFAYSRVHWHIHYQRSSLSDWLSLCGALIMSRELFGTQGQCISLALPGSTVLRLPCK